MDNKGLGEQFGLLVLGAAIGAGVTLMLITEPDDKTRRKIRRTGEDAADYLLGAGKDLVKTCEELCERSGELAEVGARELSEQYKELADRSKELASEAAKILRRAVRD